MEDAAENSDQLEVGNQVFAVGLFAQPSETHLGFRNELPWGFKKAVQLFLVPHDFGGLESLGVSVALDRSDLAAEDPVQIGPNLISSAGLNGVARRAALEDFFAFGGVLRQCRRGAESQ